MAIRKMLGVLSLMLLVTAGQQACAAGGVTRSYRINVDPNGDYTVILRAGNPAYARQVMQVVAEGKPVTALEDVSIGPGRAGLKFNAAINDGVLDLTLITTQGDPNWMISGVEVTPVMGAPPIRLNSSGRIVPGQVATFTSDPLPNKPDGSLITVTPSLGTITTPDAAPAMPGHQVAVTDGVIKFDMQMPAPPPATIIDDADPPPPFTTKGLWKPLPHLGYHDGVKYSVAGPANHVATWNFTNLTPGATYHLSATWPPKCRWAAYAPYTISEGPLAAFDGPVTVVVNQQLPPNDFLDDGVYWETLGLFTPAGRSLFVQLTNTPDGPVIADAVRIQRVLPGLQIGLLDPDTGFRGYTFFPFNNYGMPLRFGLASSLLPAGYIGLNYLNAYNFTTGYGWLTPPLVFDRGPIYADPLLHGGYYGSADGVFQTQLDPGQDYQVTLRFWDTYYRDGIQVFVNDEPAPRVEVAELPPRVAVVQSFAVLHDQLRGDGMLNLRFHDTWTSGGSADPFWIVNAIEIEPRPTPPPVPVQPPPTP